MSAKLRKLHNGSVATRGYSDIHEDAKKEVLCNSRRCSEILTRDESQPPLSCAVYSLANEISRTETKPLEMSGAEDAERVTVRNFPAAYTLWMRREGPPPGPEGWKLPNSRRFESVENSRVFFTHHVRNWLRNWEVGRYLLLHRRAKTSPSCLSRSSSEESLLVRLFSRLFIERGARCSYYLSFVNRSFFSKFRHCETTETNEFVVYLFVISSNSEWKLHNKERLSVDFVETKRRLLAPGSLYQRTQSHTYLEWYFPESTCRSPRKRPGKKYYREKKSRLSLITVAQITTHAVRSSVENIYRVA